MDQALRLLVIFLLAIPLPAQIMQQVVMSSAPVIGSSSPTLVQWKAETSDNNSQSPPTGTGSTIQSCFANPAQGGNTIVAALTTSAATIGDISLSDNKGDSYRLAVDEIAGGHTEALFVASNVTTGAVCVTVTFSGAGPNDNQTILMEWNNVATFSPVDASCAGTVTRGTAPACGSMTTRTAGDLIIDFTQVVSFAPTPTGSMTWTAQTGAGWALLSADGVDWTGIQYEVQPSAGAINPALTVSSAVTRANVVGIALKSAPSGSGPPSGIHVNGMAWMVTPGYSNVITGTTWSFQFPCYGNDLYINWQGSQTPNQTLTSITDSNGNTWSGLTEVNFAGGGAGTQWWHTSTFVACSSTEQVTVTFAATPVIGDVAPLFLFVDVSKSGGYDSAATCGGGSPPCNVSGDSDSTTIQAGSTITPSHPNGLVLSLFNQDYDSISGASSGQFVTELEDCPGVGGGGCGGSGTGTTLAYQGNGLEQDCGTSVVYNANTSAITFTWTIANTQSRGIGPYYSSTISIKP